MQESGDWLTAQYCWEPNMIFLQTRQCNYYKSCPLGLVWLGDISRERSTDMRPKCVAVRNFLAAADLNRQGSIEFNVPVRDRPSADEKRTQYGRVTCGGVEGEGAVSGRREGLDQYLEDLFYAMFIP
jgi:hypothetical protein